MRLSHQHKFVYISIHKTASSTVREMLNPYSDIKSCAPRKTICYHHIPAKKMKDFFDEKQWNWNNYFKFTTVRNPWARKLSTFSYLKRKAEEFKVKIPGGHCDWFIQKVRRIDNECANFKQYLKKYCNPNKNRNRQVDWVLDRQGNTMLDYIAKVENLEHDMNFIFDKLGLQKPKIVHANKSNHIPYTEAYDEQWMIDAVAERYKDDINHFDYKFGN